MYYPSSENKGVISFVVTAKLICAFVFAHADCWFSHVAAHFMLLHSYSNMEFTSYSFTCMWLDLLYIKLIVINVLMSSLQFTVACF